MAASQLPDFDELMLKLVQLEHRERELESRLDKAQERNGQFPTEISARNVAALTTELLDLRRTMDALRTELVPVMRTRES
jgi:predicted  nucleic acid-binding Zn-ribbon protein